jgi:two-component system, OmpR family, sensor histidine kinase KdpD
VKKRLANEILHFAFAALIVGGIVEIYFHWLHVNHATVGFSFLLAVLLISAAWGLRCAIFSAVVATIAYNYFFLPPLFHLTIADPHNWVALSAFLLTAITGSQLSERARREARKSDQRRREVERLYAFSQQLLVSDNVFGLVNAIPRFLVESFGFSTAAMYLDAKQETYLFDVSSQSLFPTDQMKAISARGEPVLNRDQQMCFMPLRLGMRSVGSIGVAGCVLSRETLEAISSLTAIAIERATTLEQLTKTEAARESDRLRSVLLDSVTHEFRTPLTAIKASAETLLSDVELEKSQRKDLLTVINEESDRLNRLVGEAAEVAQLDSHQLELHFEAHDIQEAIDMAVESVRPALSQHPLKMSVAPNLPKVRMDIERISEVLIHLLDNAAKYSATQTPIQITAELRDDHLITSVADHGPGVDDFEQEMIFEKFYRGRSLRRTIQGTGMGLAIVKAIIELHGGSVGVTSQLERGSVFYFSLPTN